MDEPHIHVVKSQLADKHQQMAENPVQSGHGAASASADGITPVDASSETTSAIHRNRAEKPVYVFSFSSRRTSLAFLSSLSATNFECRR